MSHSCRLTFSPVQIRRPLIRVISQTPPMICCIRNVNVGPELELIAIGLTGKPDVVDMALGWHQRYGVQVAPIWTSEERP